jgi:hypothetical protein
MWVKIEDLSDFYIIKWIFFVNIVNIE